MRLWASGAGASKSATAGPFPVGSAEKPLEFIAAVVRVRLAPLRDRIDGFFAFVAGLALSAAAAMGALISPGDPSSRSKPSFLRVNSGVWFCDWEDDGKRGLSSFFTG